MKFDILLFYLLMFNVDVKRVESTNLNIILRYGDNKNVMKQLADQMPNTTFEPTN